MKNKLIKDAEDSVKLGVLSMAGLNVTGQLGKLTPGSSGLQSNIATRLNLANVGQTAKVGLDVTKMLGDK